MTKTILITGANKGIGHQIALGMLEIGWHVIATARNLAKLELAFVNPAEKLTLLKLDVTDKTSIENIFETLKKQEITLDVLVNNAAMGIGNANAIEGAIDEAKAIFDVNFFGAWQTTSILLPLIKKRKGLAS